MPKGLTAAEQITALEQAHSAFVGKRGRPLLIL